jgi:ABC-type tungstate transport system permease subunit
MRRRSRGQVWPVALALGLAAGCADRRVSPRLATTTSVDNSGLLAVLLPAFRSDTGIDVQAFPVGSGLALQLLRRGDADLALTHDHGGEEAFLGEPAGLYRKVMYNLLETGHSMAATLRIASERQAYCLTDLATFTQLEGALALRPLVTGHAGLINTYAITLVPGRTSLRDTAARRFVEWLSEGAGRQVIERFLVHDVRPFTRWPIDRPRDTPWALPR